MLDSDFEADNKQDKANQLIAHLNNMHTHFEQEKLLPGKGKTESKPESGKAKTVSQTIPYDDTPYYTELFESRMNDSNSYYYYISYHLCAFSYGREYDEGYIVRSPHLYSWLHEKQEHLSAKKVLIAGPSTMHDSGKYYSPQLVEPLKIFPKSTAFDVIDNNEISCCYNKLACVTLHQAVYKNNPNAPACQFSTSGYKSRYDENLSKIPDSITNCNYEKHFFDVQCNEFKKHFPEDVKEKLTTALECLPYIEVKHEDITKPTDNAVDISNYEFVIATYVLKKRLMKEVSDVASSLTDLIYKKVNIIPENVDAILKDNFEKRMDSLYNLLDKVQDGGFLIIDNKTYQLFILGYKCFGTDDESFEDFFNKKLSRPSPAENKKHSLIEVETINAFGNPALTESFGNICPKIMQRLYGAGACQIASDGNNESYSSFALVAIKKIGSARLN